MNTGLNVPASGRATATDQYADLAIGLPLMLFVFGVVLYAIYYFTTR